MPSVPTPSFPQNCKQWLGEKGYSNPPNNHYNNPTTAINDTHSGAYHEMQIPDHTYARAQIHTHMHAHMHTNSLSLSRSSGRKTPTYLLTYSLSLSLSHTHTHTHTQTRTHKHAHTHARTHARTHIFSNHLRSANRLDQIWIIAKRGNVEPISKHTLQETELDDMIIYQRRLCVRWPCPNPVVIFTRSSGSFLFSRRKAPSDYSLNPWHLF